MDKKYSILVIEPNRHISELMNMLFSDAGYDVIHADCCEDAFGLLATDKFDLITCEVVWPGDETYRHSFEIVKEIRIIDKKVKIICITCFSNLDKIKIAQQQYNITGIALEPFDVDPFLEKVKNILEGSLSKVEVPELIGGKW